MQTEKFERIAMFQWRLSLVILSMSSLNVKLLEFLEKKQLKNQLDLSGEFIQIYNPEVSLGKMVKKTCMTICKT
jgi:hypothetical protein